MAPVAKPQMVAGHTIENDDNTWTLTLRDGLMFHDGTKVLVRNYVASIRRWGARDRFGQTLMRRTDELSAPDDRTITFRLKKPFLVSPDALGKFSPYLCPIMPERLANTYPFTQITEVVGSGPFHALMGAIDQTEFMTVVTADDPSRWPCRQAFSSGLADGK
jgi:peptide/nickel transport system substrate-binding protein